MSIQLKRAYDEPAASDGFRVIVDKFWPRGVKKEELPYDEWAKEITPSDEARQDFDHDPAQFEDFRQQYSYELDHNEQADEFLALIKEKLEAGTVTFIYAAKDEQYNHAQVLRDWVQEQLA